MPTTRAMIWLCLALLLLNITPLTAQEETPDSILPLIVEPERPFPSVSTTAEGVTLNLFFEALPQGRAGLISVSGAGVSEAQASFIDQEISLFTVEGDALYGLIVADFDEPTRLYELKVFVRKQDGTTVTLPAQIEVVIGGFLVQNDLNVPPDRAYLLDPEVERNEFARLFSVFNGYTPQRYWAEGGFQFPLRSTLISAFGSYRTFNATVPARHTGWDMRAPTSTPVMAMAAGRVAYAGLLDIRGNHVIIDHGYGIYSGYSHLSEIHVTRGQTLERGQIIGLVGNTGRSGGSHLHWEVAVNGEWVDSVEFINMWLP